MAYMAKKHDPEFVELLKKHVTLNVDTGVLAFDGVYASMHLNIGWKGSTLQIPYSHIVWLLSRGCWPKPGFHIDHVNDRPFDNRPDNLAELNEQDSQKKRRGRMVYRAYGKGKYGYGFYIGKDKRDGRFFVRRYLSRGHGDGELKTINKGLGGFDTLADAEKQVKFWIEQVKANGLTWMPGRLDTYGVKKKTTAILKHRNSIRRMRVMGATIAEVAKASNLPEGSIYKHIRDLGVDKRKNKTSGSKLTAEQIPFIRQEYADGATLAALGRDYGVTGEMIGDIVHRRAWKHI